MPAQSDSPGSATARLRDQVRGAADRQADAALLRARIRKRVRNDRVWSTGTAGEQNALDLGPREKAA